MLKLALASGGNARAITSPYKGTALIAAAHLGHAKVVEALIAAKAPLDHVNNLGWTALIEAIVLGDGGPRHQATVEALVKGGADLDLADGQGVRPLAARRAAAAMAASPRSWSRPAPSPDPSRTMLECGRIAAGAREPYRQTPWPTSASSTSPIPMCSWCYGFSPVIARDCRALRGPHAPASW